MTADIKKYDNAISFRQALEERIKNIARQRAIPLIRLRRQITFDRCGTHEIPENLEVPPDNVGDTYAVMAKDCGVEKKTMKESFAFLQEYWHKLRTC